MMRVKNKTADEQTMISSCGKKRQMVKGERNQRTSYTADILAAADARREREREREEEREKR